jgi:hypothetical protein
MFLSTRDAHGAGRADRDGSGHRRGCSGARGEASLQPLNPCSIYQRTTGEDVMAGNRRTMTRNIEGTREDLSRDLSLTDKISPSQIMEREGGHEEPPAPCASRDGRAEGTRQVWLEGRRPARRRAPTRSMARPTARSDAERPRAPARGRVAFGRLLASPLLPASEKEAQCQQVVDRAKEHGQPLRMRPGQSARDGDLLSPPPRRPRRSKEPAQESAQTVKEARRDGQVRGRPPPPSARTSRATCRPVLPTI